MIGGWFKVPCSHGAGSCKYDDVCPPKQKSAQNVFAAHGIPTTCPFNVVSTIAGIQIETLASNNKSVLQYLKTHRGVDIYTCSMYTTVQR